MTVYIYHWTRTPRGLSSENGSLRHVSPIELLGFLLRRVAHDIEIQDLHIVEECILGIVGQHQSQGGNLAKTSLLYHNMSQLINGFTINQFCCSGLTALKIGFNLIKAQSHNMLLVGGVESLSHVPLFSDGGPWYHNSIVASKTGFLPPIAAADLLANIANIERQQLDSLSLRSHQLAINAQQDPLLISLQSSIEPIPFDTSGSLLRHDEAPRSNLSFEVLNKLNPIGSVKTIPQAIARLKASNPRADYCPLHTIAHCPQVVDGAALMLLGSGHSKTHPASLQPKARILSIASASGDPVIMLTAHIEATKIALQQANLKINDIDLFEVNESFAASVIYYQQQLHIPMEKMN